MGQKIRVLIVDDHPIVRKGLHDLFEVSPDIEPVGEAVDGGEAVEMASRLHPDVTLIDLVMPNMDGIQAIGEIRRENPQARLLVLTSFAEDEKVFSAIKAGAAGYLLKDAAPQSSALARPAHGAGGRGDRTGCARAFESRNRQAIAHR